MGFQILLYHYYNIAGNLQHRYMRNLISKEARDAALHVNMMWFHDMWPDDDQPFKEVSRWDLDEATVAKYDTQKGFPLYSVIYYRNTEIPYYDDDSGQQIFTIIDGETHGGGAYNPLYAENFCQMMDYSLELRMIAAIEADYADREADCETKFISQYVRLGE